MATFDYVYIDLNGKKKKGSMEAFDQDKLIQILKAEGFMPLKISEQNVLTKDISLELGSKVKPRDLAVFCRQFHSILGAGVSILHALDMLGNETENKALAKATKKVMVSVEKGESITTAMSAQGQVFPSIFIHMMEAGEISGGFENSLLRMAEHFEKEAKLKAIVKKATIYPIIVCIVSILVIAVMLIKVIPNFMEMFAEMEMELPVLTTAVVRMSNFAMKYWILLILLSFLFTIGMKAFKASEQGKDYFSKLTLRLPLLGKLVIKSSAARLGRTLSTLLAAGISITKALEITAKSMENLQIKAILINTISEVERGIPMADTLEAAGTFPPMVSHLIRIGEQSGTTEVMLEKVAQYYEEEVETTTQSLMTALEPCMILVLSFIVGFLLLAMFQPMMQMYQGLNKL